MRGHIKQRSKGVWLVRVELARDPRTGKRRQKAETVHGTKREAEARLAQMLIDAGQACYVDAEHMTVRQYLARWLETVKGQVKANTWATYGNAVKAFLPLIGHVPMGKLTVLDVQEAVNKLQSSGKLSAGSVLRCLSSMRTALEQAVDWELIPKNQAKKVKSARYEVPEAEFWTEAEANTFLANTVMYRYHAMWWLALNSGMREGELIGLTWLDVDLDKGVAHVRRTATPYGVNDPKSTAGKRTIPLDPETVKVLKKHRKAMMEETLRCGKKWKEGGLVFFTGTGRRLSAHYCRDSFAGALKKVVKTAGIKKITFHGLRHTYATILLRRGVNINKIAKILGHANVATLLNTYTHALPQDNDQVVKVISEAFGQRKK